MNQIPNIEEEYTSHEALKEWEKEKDQNNLTQNIVALLGIHGMHCKFYEYQNASHITKAFEDLFHHQLQKAREERKGWKGYVAVDPKADNYKYSPVFSDRKGAELWVKGKEINGLEVVEVDILLVDHSELDQDITK